MTTAEPCKFRTPISRSHLHGASVKAIFQRGLPGLQTDFFQAAHVLQIVGSHGQYKYLVDSLLRVVSH
jgi:hypothetical protein